MFTGKTDRVVYSGLLHDYRANHPFWNWIVSYFSKTERCRLVAKEIEERVNDLAGRTIGKIELEKYQSVLNFKCQGYLHNNSSNEEDRELYERTLKAVNRSIANWNRKHSQ